MEPVLVEEVAINARPDNWYFWGVPLHAEKCCLLE